MIEYRHMEPDDIGAGLELCRKAKWNQLARDWQVFLELSPRGSCVAVFDGKIIGTVTTISYEHLFSWIGMVLVDPANRRQGIGLRLLQEALYILGEEETVKLDATPAGREVYLKLNFVDEYRLSRMGAVVNPVKLPVSTARSLSRDDLPTVFEFDHKVFGANRQPLLEWLFAGAPQYAFIAEGEVGIMGYCFGRPGHNFTQIGPVVATDTAIAKNLVSAALQKCIGGTVILDATHFDEEWLKWLNSIGFAEQRPFVRMYRGSNRFPGIPGKQFAILGPEFG
jgi:GNAT superfamily N-acetyltransferase